MNTTLAIDIGGTKIAYGFVADHDPLNVVGSGSVPSQPRGKRVVDQLDLAISEAISATGILPTRVGLGAPGVVRAPQGEIVYNGATIPGWAGTELRPIITRHTNAPIACHNDVRIWAYGEHQLGAGTKLSDGRVLYVSLGTGVGGAIIENGNLIDGPTGSAGEISEVVCSDFRGKADRVENIASGTSLARYYNTLSANPSAGRIPWSSPDPELPTLYDIVDRMRQGDELATQVIEGNLEGLGSCLGAINSALDLSAVVIGGGLISLGSTLMDPIRRGFDSSTLQPNRGTKLTVSTIGINSALIGAAAYARDNSY